MRLVQLPEFHHSEMLKSPKQNFGCEMTIETPITPLMKLKNLKLQHDRRVRKVVEPEPAIDLESLWEIMNDF